MSDELFKAKSPLGYTVSCSKSQWNIHIISETGHPIMKANQAAVVSTISTPDIVYKSNQSPKRDVYFSKSSLASYGEKYYTKVVVEYLDKDYANVVTTFPVKKITGGINEEELLYENASKL